MKKIAVPWPGPMLNVLQFLVNFARFQQFPIYGKMIGKNDLEMFESPNLIFMFLGEL